jgi:quercetin dioxygenase-like cupin family protein
VKRHSSLVPLSHDHHHALVEARRLRRAAGEDETTRRAAVDRFLRFFSSETIRHFREEEERLFPLLAGHEGEANALLVEALLDHQRIRALVARLERGPAADEDLMRELAGALDSHVRLEERRLFPLVEAAVPEEILSELDLSTESRDGETPVVDLLRSAGHGALWGADTEDLNATLLAWPAGGGPEEHVNRERDVVLVVLAGEAEVAVDGEPHLVHAGEALVVEKGRRRSIVAGPDGVRYLTIHRRRLLGIAPPA